MAKPTSQKKYIRRKGQQTGILNIQKKVQNHVVKHMEQIFFHRLNYVMALRTGLSLSMLLRLKSPSMKVMDQSSTQSGSGSPEGVKQRTIKQIKQRKLMQRMARNSRLRALMVTMAENREAMAQRCLLQVTVLSMMVLILRSLKLYLARERCYSSYRKFILKQMWVQLYISE